MSADSIPEKAGKDAAIGEVKPAPIPTAPIVSSSAANDYSNHLKRQGASPQGPTVKKRPYRRTKRPKNYCDKSTVTTTTPTLENTPVNVYDAVLGECEDLLTASLEAQRLGRLKMASAYQLLLHTRLVGLGKRFDRASVIPPVSRHHRANDDDDDYDGDEYSDDDDDESQATPVARGGLVLVGDSNGPVSAQEAAATSLAALSAAASKAAPAPTPEPTPPSNEGVVKTLPQALERLSSILPSNLEMDTSMMEHLARAAVELHHQRTGRKKSADGLLNSPMIGLIGSPAPSTEGIRKESNAKIAWTAEEQAIVEKGAAENKAPFAIAKLLKNKTETQVKAFLKNQAKSSEQTDALADDLGSPSKKRGGRGRKPPTTAMNTVPNANLNAKSLLKGALK